MYTITIAILTLAVQQHNKWLFLLTYVILFSFQRIISAKRDIMVKIGAYIAVFLDEDFGWEKNYSEICKRTTSAHNSKEKFSKVMNVFSGRISSLQLGIVCSTGCIIMSAYNMIQKGVSNINWWNEKKPTDIFPIFCALFLLGGLKEWCKNSLNAMQRREQYIESLRIYKTDIESKKKKSN